MQMLSLRRLSAVKRIGLALLVLIVIAGAATIGNWLPEAKKLAGLQNHSTETTDAKHDEHAGEACNEHTGEAKDEHAGETKDAHAGEAKDAHAAETKDEHAGEAHDEHAGEAEGKGPDAHKHDEGSTVTLSAEAQANVGIQVATVELKPFERTITVPAMVIEQPGRSHQQIAAPLTGVVTRIYPLQGEAVGPCQPLFDLRLTHEEVVEAQGAFLQTAEELDVVGREITRLERITIDGAIPGKILLERKYEQQKLNAMLRSQRQRLLLHGLTSEQVDDILVKRTLLREITVFVPSPTTLPNGNVPLLQVEQLKVDQGEHVKAGELLCMLADYSELCIQGKAFEQDMPALDHAANQDWQVSAVVSSNDRQRQVVPDLKILSLANTVDVESRAFLFYVRLPNKLIRDRTTADKRRFCAWEFKPGQRVDLQVPVERWKDRIVLPRDAVVQDGAESYVFEKINNHFDRCPVRVEYRDQYSVVLAADGTIKPGKTVVVAGAYQLHLALKNKAGGAPDPHAGHNH